MAKPSVYNLPYRVPDRVNVRYLSHSKTLVDFVSTTARLDARQWWPRTGVATDLRCSTILDLTSSPPPLHSSDELVRASHFVQLFICQTDQQLCSPEWARKDLNFRP